MNRVKITEKPEVFLLKDNFCFVLTQNEKLNDESTKSALVRASLTAVADALKELGFLDTKADKENFFLVGENVSVEECYQRLANVSELDNQAVYALPSGEFGTTRALLASEILHVTADGYVRMGIGYSELTDGTEAAIHCDNTHGMHINFTIDVYNALDERIEFLLLMHGDAILFRCIGEKTYLFFKKMVALSDGTHTTAIPTMTKTGSLGDMIWKNAKEFLPKTWTDQHYNVSGEFALEENGRYAVLLNGDCAFVMPYFASDGTDGRIEIILSCPYEYDVTFGDVLFANGKTPVFSVGCYKIICVYDVLYGKWCVSATEYREDWSEALGLRADFENSVFERLEAASGKSKGADFNGYTMYGGRRRCNVADDGTILAYEGEDGYVTDGSNGQVMVYQPAFYYKVIPLVLDGNKIRKAEYYISEKPLVGFQRHPAFYDANGNEIDYILFSAYEACVYDVDGGEDGLGAYLLANAQVVDYDTDKLSSITGASPVADSSTDTSATTFTKARAERLANNRGDGWHIDHVLSWSVHQLLMIIEYGSFNIQTALGYGICNSSKRVATGTLDEYGNGSYGRVSTSTQEAVLYRGAENLYGNVGSYLGGVKIMSDSVYIGMNYDYANMTTDTGLAVAKGFISAFGYNSNCDWAFLPVECDGTSSNPVGDEVHGINTLTGSTWMVGGNSGNPPGSPWSQRAGMFTIDSGYYQHKPFWGARLLFIPTAQKEDEA